MTIERHDRTDGAEALRVICDTCRVRIGATLLYALHMGYGDLATPITDDEIQKAERVAKDHEKKHPEKDHQIRVLRFRA